MLIGLGAKNALLRVTFAVELRKQGKSIMEATVLAGEMRLRPIIMTSLAFIFGVLPLAVAMGAGANARHSIGTGIIGGMIGETTLAMLYVPLFFYLFDQLTEKLEEKKKAKAQAKERRRRKGPARRRACLHEEGRGADMKRIIPIVLVIQLLVLLAGCAVGPDYKRPDLTVPGSYRYEVQDASDTANTEWWRQFEDPVLDALIDEALANNKNVKISAAKIEQAAGLLVQTRSPIFPQINYSGIAERQRLTEYGATPLSSAVPNPQTAYQVLAGGELGDRSLGPHPPADRVGAGKPAGHRVRKAGRGPFTGRLRRKLLPAAARTG